jgi:hypothetical protein
VGRKGQMGRHATAGALVLCAHSAAVSSNLGIRGAGFQQVLGALNA